MQFLNISDATTSTPSRGLLDDPMLSIILDTPSLGRNAPRLDLNIVNYFTWLLFS